MALKHLVDRYNLYFNHRAPAYKYVDSAVHSTAVTFAVISTFFLLISLLFYSVIRLGEYFRTQSLVQLTLTLRTPRYYGHPLQYIGQNPALPPAKAIEV